MDFNPLTDLRIFDDLLLTRPEIMKEKLIEDLNKYYLPFIEKLINLKTQQPSTDGLIVGISAIQGAGKSTQGEIIERLLNHLNYSSVSLSIDDHYLTHSELCILRDKDPRFIRRGVTHDVKLAIQDLTTLQTATHEPLLISGYDKSAHSGDGDRFAWINLIKDLGLGAKVVEEEQIINKQLQKTLVLKLVSVTYKNYHLDLPSNMGTDIPLLPPFLPDDLIEFLQNHQNQPVIISQDDDTTTVSFLASKTIKVAKADLPHGWRVIPKKADFIFYDGWMLGARRVEDESVFATHLPALETDADIKFAKDVNQKLTLYQPLWDLLQFTNCLYVPNYQNSLKWRDQAEDHQRQKGAGMSHEQIKEFVYYFWRSVHPAIHIKNLAHDTRNTNQVVIINDDHTIKEIITPQEAITRYP